MIKPLGPRAGHAGDMAELTAVCVVAEIHDGYRHPTAIDKRAVTGPVAVGERGLAGDEQRDRHHGGRDAAVYVYADEDAAYWADELGRDVPPGLFGENLRTCGLDVTHARIGERWRIGEVLLEVRKPRTPCPNLEKWIGVAGFHITFDRTGRVGAKCCVLETGSIRAGDEVVVEHRPDHPATIRKVSDGITPADAAALLDSGVPLASWVRNQAKRAVARG